MGEWRKGLTVKLSDAERTNLLQIHKSLAPMHENLSQTLRWCVRVTHILIFTEGSLQLLLIAVQGSQWITPYHSDKQLGFQFAEKQPPLVRFLPAENERRTS